MRAFREAHFKDLAGLFLSSAFCTYSWSLLILAWDIPSLILRFRIKDMIAYTAYELSFALLESSVVAILVFLLGFLLPRNFLRRNTRVQGTALILAFAINSIIFKEYLPIVQWLGRNLPLDAAATANIFNAVWAASLILLPILLIILASRKRLERFIEKFVDNLSVLVSIYVTLSIAGLLIVLLRNLF